MSHGPSTSDDHRALRLLVYDRTCFGARPRNNPSAAWTAGSVLYRALGRLDASFGATNWGDALDWLGTIHPERPIREIQYWGHGRWGCAMLDQEPLGARALASGHPLHPGLAKVRARLLPEGRSLLWLRTCEAFGASAGHAFARAMVDFFRCRVAGHTYVIGFWQSGLHGLRPGDAPGWPMREGIAQGSAEAPLRSLPSARGAPNTISCLAGRIPAGW